MVTELYKSLLNPVIANLIGITIWEQKPYVCLTIMRAKRKLDITFHDDSQVIISEYTSNEKFGVFTYNNYANIQLLRDRCETIEQFQNTLKLLDDILTRRI